MVSRREFAWAFVAAGYGITKVAVLKSGAHRGFRRVPPVVGDADQ